MNELELVEALREAMKVKNVTDALTVTEIAEQTGIQARRVREALTRLARQGRLAVHKVYRVDLSGRTQQVPAYTLIDPKKRA